MANEGKIAEAAEQMQLPKSFISLSRVLATEADKTAEVVVDAIKGFKTAFMEIQD